MGKKLKTPGVYIEEVISPASAVAVPTAIPAFIGFTERRPHPSQPTRIRSLSEYQALFGGSAGPENINIHPDNEANELTKGSFKLYPSLRLFFANGGDDCYIVSIGTYANSLAMDCNSFTEGLDLLRTVDEITLLAFPDAVNLGALGLGQVQQRALLQCAQLKDRFCILDVLQEAGASHETNCAKFRNALGSRNLSYGAAYYPYLQINSEYKFSRKDHVEKVLMEKRLPSDENFQKTLKASYQTPGNLRKLQKYNNPEAGKLTVSLPSYTKITAELTESVDTVPPSGAIAGLYATNDASRGVWKAPANMSINGITGVTAAIGDRDQEGMNVHESGKSINAIREFPGRGILVWGARTLDSASNEWRYISVRRLGIMIEEAVREACFQLVSAPNSAPTWAKAKGMMETYLDDLWRKGAFAGAKPEHAFFVRLGLNDTMTVDDINDGRMIVVLGYAPTRPAEFIVLRLTLQQV